MLKFIVQRILESYVKKYFKIHPDVKLVAVTGSVGKTTTKIAIATVLSERFRVRLHEGNYNSKLSVPTAILGIEYPSQIRNPLNWLSVFKAARIRIKSSSDVDVIVQELGSDRIGEINHYGKYLKPDISVITSVAPEHIEYFHSIDNVAREELAVANYSKTALINHDDIDANFANYLKNPNINTYGTSSKSEYYIEAVSYDHRTGYEANFFSPESPKPTRMQIKVLGEHSLRPIVAAGAVATELGLTKLEIKSGAEKCRAVAGRMNVLAGFENSIIIDDTYNSSPLACACAIKALKDVREPSTSQKIAVLGDMNELGKDSVAEHKKIGELCHPEDIEWVVTVGAQAKKYIATAAKANGCQVRSFDNALQAGVFVRSIMEADAVILFKGSQGGIYLEEAVKFVLLDDDDESKLVRQSPEWMAKKQQFFSKFSN